MTTMGFIGQGAGVLGQLKGWKILAGVFPFFYVR